MVQWYVTWRHSNKSPMEATTYPARNKEHAEEMQKGFLKDHESEICLHCSWHLGAVHENYVNGNNDFIVTRIRTREAIERTVIQNYRRVTRGGGDV